MTTESRKGDRRTSLARCFGSGPHRQNTVVTVHRGSSHTVTSVSSSHLASISDHLVSETSRVP